MELAEGANEDLEDSNDLREHMVGILFSRSNLTHLQKQVCTHIVQAIRKETIRLREEWETLLCSPTPANSRGVTSSRIVELRGDVSSPSLRLLVGALSSRLISLDHTSSRST